MSPRAAARLAFLLLAAHGPLSGLPPAAAGGQRFRSSSELVTVDVLVTDGRRPISGLGPADFELRDSGVLQTIEQLYVESLPLNVVMVLDTSRSVEGERLASLKRGASAMVDRLRPGDRAAIVSFSHRLDLHAPLTGDAAALSAAVAALAPEGSTALRDAAFAALAIRSSDAARTLVLLFSDGVDTSSLLGDAHVIDAARRSDVIIYAIGIREAVTTPARGGRVAGQPVYSAATDAGFLQAVARETGGRLVYAENDRDIGAAFGRVLEEFNSRYVLGYAPTGVAGPGWRPIDVRLKGRKGTVLARRGYFAG